MGSSDIEHAVKLLTQNELAMDEIESIWEKVRSGKIVDISIQSMSREEGKIRKNDLKGDIFMKCVLRGNCRRASFPTAFVFGRGRQTRGRRALILIGDRVTAAAPFSWSAKSAVARIVPTPPIVPCQVHDVFLLNADSTPLRILRAR